MSSNFAKKRKRGEGEAKEESPRRSSLPKAKRRRRRSSTESKENEKAKDAAKPTTSVGRKAKRSEADVRNDMLQKGALLLEFRTLRKASSQEVDRWRAVEKKGFLVTEKGCLFPAACHLFGNRSKKVGYDRALSFFEGKARDPGTAGSVNEHGWDCEDTVSHLCHRDDCCARSHLELVARWKNLKRNYCGANGGCDCGMVPTCVDTYHPPSFPRKPDTLLRYDTPGLSAKIKGLFETDDVEVKILPATHYRKQDIKRENRNKRIKGSKKTVKGTKKNNKA